MMVLSGREKSFTMSLAVYKQYMSETDGRVHWPTPIFAQSCAVLQGGPE